MNRKAASLSYLAGYADRSPEALNDPCRNGQSQTGSPAGRFGGKKGIKQPVDMLSSDTYATIFDFK
jgi:hypothetical protein